MSTNEGQETGQEQPTAEAPAEDPVKNLKSEFSRKMGNMEEQLQQLYQHVVAQGGTKTPAQAAAPKKASELLYEDPDLAIAQIKSEIRSEIEGQRAVETQTQSAITQLSADYPELVDVKSDLRKASEQNYAKLPKHLRDTPEGYKLAVREAAADLGVIVSSKRKAADNSNDDFVVPGRGSSGQSSRRPSKADEPENFNQILDDARRMGLDTSKKEVVENLKNRAKNSTFGYRGGR